MWYHPKYYKELRKRNRDLLELSRSEQAQDRSVPQSDQVISSEAGDGERERSPGPGPKLQATSNKPQAASSEKNRPQASSPKQQASSSKPQAASSMILEPRKSFTVHGSRASTMINVLCGCLT